MERRSSQEMSVRSHGVDQVVIGCRAGFKPCWMMRQVEDMRNGGFSGSEISSQIANFATLHLTSNKVGLPRSNPIQVAILGTYCNPR